MIITSDLLAELGPFYRVLNQTDYFNSPPPVGGCSPPTGTPPPGRRRIKIVSLIICFITFPGFEPFLDIRTKEHIQSVIQLMSNNLFNSLQSR